VIDPAGLPKTIRPPRVPTIVKAGGIFTVPIRSSIADPPGAYFVTARERQ
jgi:hypothetical protein